MNRRPLVRLLLASAATTAMIALGGCYTDSVLVKSALRAEQPLSPQMVALLHQKHMDKGSPILVRIFKQEAVLELWKQDDTGRFALLKTYPICRWSGELGPKKHEGDRQAPEGFYEITPAQLNPHSDYYLAFNIGFPNAYDRAWGRTGSDLMVHGNCSSRGCYAMTDEQIGEIYALARDAFYGGQKEFQVQAYPFRMTPENMARHRGNPNMAFWEMLKRGYDHFAVTHLPPKVNVCDRHYVFDAESPKGPATPIHFSPTGRCPNYVVPADIAAAVTEKEQRDNRLTAELVREGVPEAPIKTGTDGGMNPVFLAALKARNHPNDVVHAPGTLPPLVNPPGPPHPVYGPPNAPAPLVASIEPAAPATTTSAPVQTAAAAPAQQAAAASSASSGGSGGGGFLAGIGSLFQGSGSAATQPLVGTPKPAQPAIAQSATRQPQPAVASRQPKPAAHPAPKPQVATAQARTPAKPAPAAAASAAPRLRLAATPHRTKAPAQHAPTQVTVQAAHHARRVARRHTSPWALRGSSANALASAVPMSMESLAQPGLPPDASALAEPGTTIRGAQPVRPAGGFENRWSGLR